MSGVCVCVYVCVCVCVCVQQFMYLSSYMSLSFGNRSLFNFYLAAALGFLIYHLTIAILNWIRQMGSLIFGLSSKVPVRVTITTYFCGC